MSRELWPFEAPPMCPRPTPGENSIAYPRKKRVEWLARYRFIYLTNSANSRVRSTHLLHTKSPFSRFFFGCRRQKNKNIVVSARGRRTPQALTLRILGCVNARQYDFKSSSLYSQSSLLGTGLRSPFRTSGGRSRPPPRFPGPLPVAAPVRARTERAERTSTSGFARTALDMHA